MKMGLVYAKAYNVDRELPLAIQGLNLYDQFQNRMFFKPKTTIIG